MKNIAKTIAQSAFFSEKENMSWKIRISLHTNELQRGHEWLKSFSLSFGKKCQKLSIFQLFHSGDGSNLVISGQILFSSKILNCCEKNNLWKGNKLADDQQDVDHLGVGGGGRLSILLMKIVVITNIVVRFTLKAASKKNGLKKLVA